MSGGAGLMDEDGSHPWVGTNAYCLQPAYACNGTLNPLPNANPNLAADVDPWIAQFSAQFHKPYRGVLRKYAPNVMFFGADTEGTWGAPPRKEILQGAAPYVDGLFPASVGTQANINYIAQAFGDKPFFIGTMIAATPDSVLYRYPGATAGVYDFPTQQQRGQTYLQQIQAILNVQAAATSSFPIIGINWWGLVDFWNERIDWGLVSLNDNPYDGKSATKVARTDPWGYQTGGEDKDYGDTIDYFKQANTLWYLIAKPLP